MTGAAALQRLRPPRGGGPPRPRLDRLAPFIGAPADSREALRRLRVLAVGAGSVGARAVEHLARLRVGEIAIVDPGRFSAAFDTQDVRGEDEVGRAKAICVGRRAAAIDPALAVRAFVGPIQAIPWMALDRYDLVLAATDNLKAEIDLGQACTWLGTPLVYASVHGASLTAQVRTWLNGDGGAPCPACGFSRAERESLGRQVRYACAPGSAAEVLAAPTTGASALCSLAADLAVLEVLRRALRLGPAPRDAMLEYNAYRGETCTAPLRRNPACPCDHTVFARVSVRGALGERTLRDCARAAGVRDEELPRTSFAADGLSFARSLDCGACGESRPFNRFIGAAERLRCRCGARAGAGQRFFTFEGLVPAREGGLLAQIDVPLRRLRAGRFGVAVRNDRVAVLVRAGEPAGGVP
jgi:molybdopterin/thiamine biosynthesis adenylyltransferase